MVLHGKNYKTFLINMFKSINQSSMTSLNIKCQTWIIAFLLTDFFYKIWLIFQSFWKKIISTLWKAKKKNQEESVGCFIIIYVNIFESYSNLKLVLVHENKKKTITLNKVQKDIFIFNI